MTQKEFNKLKVGDKVRIVKKKKGYCWNKNGKMDKWLGKTMTINHKGFFTNFLIMEEDDGRWYWFANMIDCKVEDTKPTITEHIVKDDKVIVKLSNGKVGVAKCHEDDKFDIAVGTKLAIERAYGKGNITKKTELHLMSGSEDFGVVGRKTKFTDIHGNNLCVGDIVKVFDWNGEFLHKAYIVQRGEEQFVMGKRYLPFVHGFNAKLDFIIKITDHSQIENGTKVDIIMAMARNK